uniref:flagellar basal body-associated FliL family protein n=1 Tax=Massilibacillus massiliensis TaxID=1806837 RepID=UPI0018FE4607|nr:flagellar basal body-associated FliL family protein [Massilibacillus massiliensis]
MAEEGTKKKSPMLMIVGLIVVGLILAGGMSYFIATKVMTDSVGKVPSRDPGIFVKLGDPKEGVIVNVGGVKSGRYLKVGVVLELDPEKAGSKDGKITPAVETKILDSVLQLLRAQKIENFDPSKQEELKVQIKDEVNKILGENTVYQVYITNFVLQ